MIPFSVHMSDRVPVTDCVLGSRI